MKIPFKIKRILSPIIITFAICISAVAQDTNTKPILRNEFGTNCYEEFAASMDAYAQDIIHSPESIGVIFMTGEQNREGQNLNYLKWLKEYLTVSWKINEDRIVMLRHPDGEKRNFEFWIYPQSEVSKISVEKYSFEFSGDTIFDRAWADVLGKRYEPEYGEETMFGDPFHRGGCDFGPNTPAFAAILLSNETYNGHIVIFNESRKNTKKIKDFALNELVNRYKVPRNRLKVFYGGKRSDPEVEFWLVPEGSKPLKDLKELK